MNTYEWIDIGGSRVPEQHRDTFLAHLRGEQTNGVDHCNHEGETPQWRYPNGSFPMSPGMALNSIVTEFGLRGVAAVSYNMAWLAHDTTGQPGYFGDYSGTYTILGVQIGKRQRIYFIDGGVEITPLLIERPAEGEEFPILPRPAEDVA